MAKHSSVLITGCSSGIGKDIALTLHDKGYEVVATVRNAQDIALFSTLGIACYELDIASSHSIASSVPTILSNHSALSAVVHNGAYGQPGALMDISRTTLIEQFQTNVFGTHELTNALLPHFIALPHAQIIYISSVLGIVSAPMRGAYNSSKFALEGLASTLRLELESTNVGVSIIQPGPIESEFRKNALLKFEQNITKEGSYYQDTYDKMLQRLSAPKSTSKWTLPASSVTRTVEHALGRSPKLYYRITTPTKIIALLLKVLPMKMIDKIMKNQ